MRYVFLVEDLIDPLGPGNLFVVEQIKNVQQDYFNLLFEYNIGSLSDEDIDDKITNL